MFEHGGVGFKVLACYPSYGAVDINTEIMLSDQALTLTPATEVTVVVTSTDQPGHEEVLAALTSLQSIHEGQEVVIADVSAILINIPASSGKVTASTVVTIKRVEAARECVVGPIEGTVGSRGGTRFEAVRLLGDTLSLLRRGRRLFAQVGGQVTIGGLRLQVGHLFPREAIITGETAVQVVSTLRAYHPPPPPSPLSPRLRHAIKHMPPLPDSEFSSSVEILCTVCQTSLTVGCRVVTLGCCKSYAAHMYHTECITPWLATNRHCPVCKSQVL